MKIYSIYTKSSVSEYLAILLNVFSSFNKRNIVDTMLLKAAVLTFFELAFCNILISSVPNTLVNIKDNQLKQPLLSLCRSKLQFFTVLIFG